MSDLSIPQKQCSKCKQFYPATIEYFFKRSDRPCGITAKCKQCSSKIGKEYYLAHPEQKEKARVRMDKSRAENPELHRERSRKFAATHKAEAVARAKKWTEDHPERAKALFQASYLKRKSDPEKYEKMKQTTAACLKKNPAIGRTRNQRRRGRIKAAEGTHSTKDIQEMYIAQDGKCKYCGCELNGKYHIDHVQPLTRGGSNWPSNLALACPSCNFSKSNSTLDEWVARRGW